MTGYRHILLGVSAAALCTAGTLASAYGADPILIDPVEIEISGEVSAAAGLVDDNAAADANAVVNVVGSSILNNGLELGANLSARLDGDQPRQGFAAGRYSSLLIGGPRGIAPLSSDAFLQGASVYAKGAFGEFIAGRDQGVAQRFAVTAPTIFRAVNVNGFQTDLSGINDVHTLNDFTGYSTKFTYLPPSNLFGGALGRLRLGVSYSPTLQPCGDRLCAPQDGFAISPEGTLLTEGARWQDAIEAGLYYEQGFGRGQDRLFVGVGASFVTADEDVLSASPIFDNYEAYAVGLNLAYRGFTVGGSIKTTNSGIASLDNDGYLAFDAGVTFRTGEEKGDFGFQLGYGQSESNGVGQNPLDQNLFRDTQTAQAGVTYVVGRGVTIGAAAQYVESDEPDLTGGNENAATVVIESSIKF